MLIWKGLILPFVCLSQMEVVGDFDFEIRHTGKPTRCSAVGRCWNWTGMSLCLASCGIVRVSGGLKSSWGRAVGQHSSMTLLSCYSHQTAFNNLSLFAEIQIGLHWNAATHSAPDKILQNTVTEDSVSWFFLTYGTEKGQCNTLCILQKYVETPLYTEYLSVLLVWVCLGSSRGKS